jgi:hypothetical protein
LEEVLRQRLAAGDLEIVEIDVPLGQINTFPPTVITVDGVTCTYSFLGDPCSGSITMTMAPIPSLLPGQSVTEPFTAAGHINVGDLDIVGQGVLTFTEAEPLALFPATATFDFVTPEPSTLVLLGSGLAVVGLLRRTARRRETLLVRREHKFAPHPLQRRVAIDM